MCVASWLTVDDEGELFSPEMEMAATGTPPRREKGKVILLHESSIPILTGTGFVDIVSVHLIDLLRNSGDHLSHDVLIATWKQLS